MTTSQAIVPELAALHSRMFTAAAKEESTAVALDLLAPNADPWVLLDADVPELHPAREIFPVITEDNFLRLVESIREVGQLEPITVLDGLVLDGASRWRACLQLGLQPRTETFVGDNPLAFVLAKHFQGKVLTGDQRAATVARLQNWDKAARHGGRRDQVSFVTLDTAEARAYHANVKIGCQRRVDRIAMQRPDLLEQVKEGSLTASAATKQMQPKPLENTSGEKPTCKERIAALEADAAALEANFAALEAHVAALEATVATLEAEKLEAQEKVTDALCKNLNLEMAKSTLSERVQALERRVMELTAAAPTPLPPICIQPPQQQSPVLSTRFRELDGDRI